MKYRVTAAGRTAWETNDAAVPSDYRMLLWMVDFHGSAHTETFISQFPEQNLADCLAELVELGLMESAEPEEPQLRQPHASVLAIAQTELPNVAHALARHGAYIAKDRMRRRSPGSPTRPVRVLIVEDDPDQLALADLRVSLAGFGVVTADSQAAMLRSIADRGRPDVILLDVMLPDGNGFLILQNFRKFAQFADLPIVMLTARAAPADILEGLRLGADGYITKPYSKTLLASVVRQVLGLPEET